MPTTKLIDKYPMAYLCDYREVFMAVKNNIFINLNHHCIPDGPDGPDSNDNYFILRRCCMYNNPCDMYVYVCVCVCV